MHGLPKEGQIEKANSLLIDMEEKGVSPNVDTFTTLMNGFIQINGTEKVIELLHKMAERIVMPDSAIFSVVVDLLVKNKISLNSLPSFNFQEPKVS